MATVEMVLPAMGESIMEATVLQWLKKEGDTIEEDESILEVATDKVDTEVPAAHGGVLQKILIQEGDVAQVGKPIAVIEQENGAAKEESTLVAAVVEEEERVAVQEPSQPAAKSSPPTPKTETTRFYSPLVKNIAREEGISVAELEQVEGSGKEGRVTKKDILNYIKHKQSGNGHSSPTSASQPTQASLVPVTAQAGDEVIAMDRMRKMIAGRMLDSQRISAHVTSFVEADVTNIVLWRSKNKQDFEQREGEKLTFTPIFVEAVAKALKDYPMINISVDGDKIIKRKNINVGMAVALPSGNLIVPVIKNADQLSLLGLTKQVNSLAEKARNNQLSADDLSNGTYTLSNIGSFGNTLGTPIIMQPQVAILAVGAIVKKPSVIETPSGDAIAIRHKMYLSHSYDHRVVDGALGGLFVRKVADYLEQFDLNRMT
ncbi:dihydrolipoamide acetyltransferase family protein [Tunicatimonas pelagia]|uniref:dihydrolipoamide acetyltransferase family protein n=1 Tax=Tunicatimonas pelagia TaxID=931531 RepID=UPI0026650CBF|nr:dihydrolipoamide acetyltransferase family protein [Tunicatimonas pelagia]WKN42465.1 dihydrolipoamide acetyltransferase family protein [Tunicatimonas pelagia]